MNPNTRRLHELGQSLWLDNISREMLEDGTLARYISELSVTGLTSNPSIFEKTINGGTVYDAAIGELARKGLSGEDLFIKIPGTPAGIPAIEESIFAGVPINVTLLFSREHYLAAAAAYLRGIERRIAAGLDPKVESVASLFVSRWDVAVKDRLPSRHRNRLGIAIAMRTYRAYRDLLASARWRKLAAAGAHVQRMLWASTGTKDPDASDTLYVEAFAAPGTINTLPEDTLQAFADHGKVGATMPLDGGDAEALLDELRREGVDDDELAARLQREGAGKFAKSWNALLSGIGEKASRLAGRNRS